MVGILISFGDGLFSGGYVSFREGNMSFKKKRSLQIPNFRSGDFPGTKFFAEHFWGGSTDELTKAWDENVATPPRRIREMQVNPL